MPAKKTINVSRKPARVPQVLLFKATVNLIAPGQSQRPWRTIALETSAEARELAEAIIEAFEFEPDKQFGFYSNLGNYMLSESVYSTFPDDDDDDFDDDDDSDDDDDLNPAARARMEAFVAEQMGGELDMNAPADLDLVEVATAAATINAEEVYSEVQVVASQLFYERMTARLQAALPERLHGLAATMLGSMKDAAALEAQALDDEDDFENDDDNDEDDDDDDSDFFSDDEFDNDHGLDVSLALPFPQVGHKMLFIYDHGSIWRFEVEFMGSQPRQPGMNYPLIVEEKGQAPNQHQPFGE
jgi:hypothetical protein